MFTLLYSFAEVPDGSLRNGAAPTSLFKLSKTGTITLLHSFCNTIDCSDGSNPAFLTQGIDGNFYGATGPNNPPTSILFRMNSSG